MSELLCEWYEKEARELPWRIKRDSYSVWVSEIMLQQTKVEAVKPYYKRFMEMFPTIYDLANAEEDVLLKVWEGLGYYSRVKNMQKAARHCVEYYDGNLPSTYDELLTLSGIGPYTAGAIASIAYHKQVCAIDGNVLRVYARLFCIEEDILKKDTQAKIHELIKQDMAKDMGIMNQAIMDLGALICIPSGNVRCNICPLRKKCMAYQNHKVNVLPIRNKKIKRKVIKYTVMIYICDGYVAIHKRKEGLLNGLYEFCLIDGHLLKKDNKDCIYLGKSKHIFSHLEWNMKGFIKELDEKRIMQDYIWVKISELKNVYSIPKAYDYYLKQLYELYQK